MFPTFRRKGGTDYSRGRLSLLLMRGARQDAVGLSLWRTWEGYAPACIRVVQPLTFTRGEMPDHSKSQM